MNRFSVVILLQLKGQTQLFHKINERALVAFLASDLIHFLYIQAFAVLAVCAL